MAELEKGTISALEGPKDRNGDDTMARILPCTREGSVTRPLVIPWWLRGEMGRLRPGVPVAFACFEDMTGLVLGRADGEWGGVIPGDALLRGTLTAQDFSTQQVPCYNSHVHRDVAAGPDTTGAPQGGAAPSP